MSKPTIAKIQEWILETYDFEKDQAQQIATCIHNNDISTLITLFTSAKEKDETKAKKDAKLMVATLHIAFKEHFPKSGKSDTPRAPERGSVDVTVEDLPKEESVDEPKDKTNDVPADEVPPESVVSEPDTPLLGDLPPKSRPSKGIGYQQVQVIKDMFASVKKIPFNATDPDSGGLKLDDHRSVFLSLLARGEVCEVRDAIVRTPKGRLRWGKKVLPLPGAKDILKDYDKRQKE